MKKLNIFAAAALSGVLLLTGCNQEEPQEKAAPVYEDEYTFSYWEVEVVTHKNEVYASSMFEGEGGYYIDENKAGAKAGDLIKVVEDAATGEYIAFEVVEDE